MSVCLCSCISPVPFYIGNWHLSDSAIFSTLPHKQYDFQKHITEHKMGLVFSTTETLLTLRRTEGDINVHKSSCQVCYSYKNFNGT